MMGAANTKILNTFSGVLTRRDSKRSSSDDSESTKMLFRVRSNSLDSISTCLSVGTVTEPQQLSRASSLDNLHSTPKHTRVINIHGKQYMLLDNSSVSSATTDKSSPWLDVRKISPVQDRETSLSHEGKKKVSCTQSEPIQSSYCVKKEPDQFSDSFVMGETPVTGLAHAEGSQVLSKESKSCSMPNRSILKDRKTASLAVPQTGLPDESLSKLLSDYPHITPAVHAKLTPEEWEQVINFACASLGKSMQMIRKLGENHNSNRPDNSCTENRETNSSSDSLTQKHVTINEEVSTSIYNRGSAVAGMDGTTSVEALKTRERTRQRRQRKDRPNSLPPVYFRGTESPESLRSTGELESTIPRARANSYEGNYFKRCSSDSVKPKLDTYYPCSSRTRRKKAAKGMQRNPNAPVDISLEDNCPGVAKHRRTHRHTHRHSFCKQYERRPIKDRSYSAEDTRVMSSDQKHDHLSHATLYDMRTAAMVFKRSAEITEESVASAFARSAFKQACYKSHQTNDADTENFEVIYSTVHDTSAEGYRHGWNELVFPKSTRSGRDSPATDMAVISLDLNHPSMLEPIKVKGDNNNQSTSMNPPQTILHNHNHYHHIIHHTQS